MVSFGGVVALIFAILFAVLVAFLVLVLVKLGQVLTETAKLVAGITDRTVPLLSEATTSIVHVNTNLERVDVITSNVETVTTNASALSSVFAATLGGPLVRVAAFSYGVRRALAERERHDIEKRVKAELKAERRRARAERKAGSGGGAAS
jgi:predicted PurR-regulated permease PerM